MLLRYEFQFNPNLFETTPPPFIEIKFNNIVFVALKLEFVLTGSQLELMVKCMFANSQLSKRVEVILFNKLSNFQNCIPALWKFQFFF